MPSSPSPALSAEAIISELTAIPTRQPVQALQDADQHREALIERLLQALESGLKDPQKSFEEEGVLFNYATYLLAKWREPRAWPLFVRWFSLPGELAFDLGSDTIARDGARLLASVCRNQTAGLKELVANTQANEICRGEALKAFAVLAAWGELPKDEVESYYQFLAREGLERKPSRLWDKLAALCGSIEAISVFPELRRAYSEQLIDTKLVPPATLDQEEQRQRGGTFRLWSAAHPPITDVVEETRDWAGYRAAASAASEGTSRIVGLPGQTYLAPEKAGRNDPCPCGSGKKFKKCCGSGAA